MVRPLLLDPPLAAGGSGRTSGAIRNQASSSNRRELRLLTLVLRCPQLPGATVVAQRKTGGEGLGVTRGINRRLEGNCLVRPSMLKILDAGGSVLGAIERWQPAKPKPANTKPRRLDCAVLDFEAMGIG